MAHISYSKAAKVVAAALKHASEIGSASSVAVVDEGRNLVAFGRQDDAILASIEVSLAKAFTAASLRMATADLAAYVQPGAPFYGLAGSHGTPLIPFGGGHVLMSGGVAVGAVGVAGGTPDKDDAIAAFAAKALSAELSS